MKNVKMILGTVLLSVLFSNTMHAQDRPVLTPEKKEEIKNQMQANKDRLALTPEQQVPFRGIIKLYAEKMRELRKSELTTSEKKIKMQEINAGRDAEMKNLLTAEQFKTYLELQEERRSKIIDMRKAKNGMQ